MFARYFGPTVVALSIGLASLTTMHEASAASLLVWHHGSDAENPAITAQIAAWNQTHPDTPAELVLLPEKTYDQNVQAAALAGKLPDLLDFDGPNYGNYVWSGYLTRLDGLVSKTLIDNLLPSILSSGTYGPDGGLYAIGQFDSGLGIWASRSALLKAHVRIPQGVADAWTGEEFNQVLAALKSAGYPTPLDLKLNYGRGEWFTFGLMPMVISYGGDLIDRTKWRAEGAMNSAGSVEALTQLQSWVRNGYVVPAEAGDDAFYAKKTAALSLVGHWMWPTYSKALGDDLLLLPYPKFGSRHVTGMGSWVWGISSTSRVKPDAVRLLEFLMNDANIIAMTKVNGAVPATRSAAEHVPEFQAGGQLNLYIQQLSTIAVPRPAHPGYPTITAAFANAVDAVINGADPKASLDQAAMNIDDEILRTDGYRPF